MTSISYAGQASNFGWANDIARDDDQERSVILGGMNSRSFHGGVDLHSILMVQ